MKILITELLSKCQPVYYQILAQGNLVHGEISIEDQIAQPLLEQCTAEPQPFAQPIFKNPTHRLPQSAPVKLNIERPAWAKTLKALRKDGEIGIGDTAERIFGSLGGTAFKIAFKAMFKRDCGCNARKDLWNTLYPY